MEGISQDVAPAAEVATAEYWEGNKEIPIARDFFTLQFEFAKKMAKHAERPLLNMVEEYAPFINRHIYQWDEREDGAPPHLIEGVTEDTMLDISYARYLETVGDWPLSYNRGRRFGCFAYDYDAHRKAAQIHFMNAEYSADGPLSSSKVPYRKYEMRDVLKDIQKNHSDAAVVEGRSWLYNLEAYRRLFPGEYLANARADSNSELWRKGTTVWGQFLDSGSNVKEDLARILLERMESQKFATPSELLSAPLFLPMHVEGPISDFYRHFKIESNPSLESSASS
ncbi:MAG TPA: hypothetical protein VNU47_01380 [Candidatus Paceibacterota bacterium]|nr:hypothetical protein [Candidatus Paceibacterota bacterium]